jgi:formylglycine-generating enzyme required for sulfatase activity
VAITEERLGQEIWSDLQSNVQERIHGAILMLNERERHIALIDLVRMVGTPNQYSVSERVSVGKALSFLGDPRIRVHNPNLMRVPGGEFTMGTASEAIGGTSSEDVGQELDVVDQSQTNGPGEGAAPMTEQSRVRIETPAHTVEVAPFSIGKFPVTNHEFHAYVLTGRARPRDYWDGSNVDPWIQNQPVRDVTWEEAVGYCDWLADETGLPFRLPTEEQWEKAARGTDARQYPWGDEFGFTFANVWEGCVAEPTPVGVYPDGVSPYGVLDMAGNVSEWTASFIGKYPDSLGEELITSQVEEFGRYRVIRGGCWLDNQQQARCARRGNPADRTAPTIGFRLALEG